MCPWGAKEAQSRADMPTVGTLPTGQVQNCANRNLAWDSPHRKQALNQLVSLSSLGQFPSLLFVKIEPPLAGKRRQGKVTVQMKSWHLDSSCLSTQPEIGGGESVPSTELSSSQVAPRKPSGWWLCPFLGRGCTALPHGHCLWSSSPSGLQSSPVWEQRGETGAPLPWPSSPTFPGIFHALKTGRRSKKENQYQP